MKQYLRDSYSKKDLANVLKVSEEALEERLNKNSDKQEYLPCEYFSGIINSDGKKLNCVKEIYLDKGKESSDRYELLYVEFEDKNGLTYSYVKDSQTVKEQMSMDGFSANLPQTYKSNESYQKEEAVHNSAQDNLVNENDLKISQKHKEFFQKESDTVAYNSSQSKREKFFDESKGNDEQQRNLRENSLNNYQSNGR